MKVKVFVYALLFFISGIALSGYTEPWPECDWVGEWHVTPHYPSGELGCIPFEYCTNPAEMGQSRCVAHWGVPSAPSPCFSNE